MTIIESAQAQTPPSATASEMPIRVGEIMASHPAHHQLPHASEYAQGSAFIIDHCCPIDRAAIPITDLGFNRADAVYDVVTVSRGNFFRLEEHQQRFAESCERIRVNNPLNREQEAKLLHQLVALTGFKDAYVWWAVTRGKTPMDSSLRLKPEAFENRLYAYVLPYIFIANDDRRQSGLNVAVSRDYIRIPPNAVDPTAKNLNGLDFAMSLYEAGDRGADWAVVTDGEGHVVEAPGSNLFVIKNGVVSTPQSGCLQGVTRQSTLDLCNQVEVKTETRLVKTQELLDADEAFVTSSAGGIMPINSVDGKPLGGYEGPGPLTTRLHNLYWEKRWNGWDATPVNYDDLPSC
jgi:branched-chain amino acid aminotransferase